VDCHFGNVDQQEIAVNKQINRVDYDPLCDKLPEGMSPPAACPNNGMAKDDIYTLQSNSVFRQRLGNASALSENCWYMEHPKCKTNTLLR
jgi:hypothetical protein